jgi:hypothetical protein
MALFFLCDKEQKIVYHAYTQLQQFTYLKTTFSNILIKIVSAF